MGIGVLEEYLSENRLKPNIKILNNIKKNKFIYSVACAVVYASYIPYNHTIMYIIQGMIPTMNNVANAPSINATTKIINPFIIFPA